MGDYWTECAEAALEDAGISATSEQIETVANFIEISHENYGMAYGYDVIGRGAESPEGRELRELKAEIRKREDWVNSTVPCRSCLTTGIVRDSWGRDQTCFNCDGKGRVGRRYG